MEGRSLALVRHAKSSWADAELADRDRPLSPRGRRAAAAVGQHLRDVGVHPDLALCSPAIRARQTLELLHLARTTEILFEEELYGASPGDLLARLHRIPSEVSSALLVGHNPAVEQLSRQLVKVASALPEK